MQDIMIRTEDGEVRKHRLVGYNLGVPMYMEREGEDIDEKMIYYPCPSDAVPAANIIEHQKIHPLDGRLVPAGKVYWKIIPEKDAPPAGWYLTPEEALAGAKTPAEPSKAASEAETKTAK